MSWRWSFLHTYVKYLVLLAHFLVILLAYMFPGYNNSQIRILKPIK